MMCGNDLTFQEISMTCPYGRWGYEGRSGYNYGFEWTCRNKNNIPEGHSWGSCSEGACPLLPRKITNLTVFNGDGNVVISVEEAVYYKGK